MENKHKGEITPQGYVYGDEPQAHHFFWEDDINGTMAEYNEENEQPLPEHEPAN